MPWESPNDPSTHRVYPKRLPPGHVTHANAISALIALATEPPVGPWPDAAVRDAATAHVARCSDCWTSLARLLEQATGQRPADDARMRALFGCETIQDVLYELVGLDAAAIARTAPAAARHLGWCHACRSRFAELVLVERDVRDAAEPRWTEVLTKAGERAHEVAGRVVVRIGRAVAGLLEVPEGFGVFGPGLAAAAVRTAALEAVGDAPRPLGQSTRFELGETGVWAELGVESADDAHVTLALRLSTHEAGPFSVHIHEVRSDEEVLVARHTLRGEEPVVVRGLWPGSFIVELHEPRDGQCYRVRLDVGSRN